MPAPSFFHVTALNCAALNCAAPAGAAPACAPVPAPTPAATHPLGARWVDADGRRYVLRALQAADAALLGDLWNQGLSRPSRLKRFHASLGCISQPRLQTCCQPQPAQGEAFLITQLLRPGLGWAEALRNSADQPLPRLSTRLAPQGLPGLPLQRLRRRLQGDLDNIIAQALQRDPQARYATATELAEDLQRHLQQRPVRARPPSVTYQFARFARRQRLPLAVLGVGLLASAVLGTQAWQQQQAARLNQARATGVAAFCKACLLA